MNRARVISVSSLSQTWHLMKLEPETKVEAFPGQFIHLRLTETTDPLLRRPFSVHYIDPKDNSLWILFEELGKGTALMSQLSPGNMVEFLGPLGNGFKLGEKDQDIAIVAGGIGVAPLYFLASVLQQKNINSTFLFGVKTRSEVPDLDHFRQIGVEPVLYTEDGSLGKKGKVTKGLRELFNHREEQNKMNPDGILACGPLKMLSAVVEEANLENIPVQVSLEAPMACGVGACLGCVCRIKTGEDANSSEYRRVCKEGPVFPGEMVVFEDVSE